MDSRELASAVNTAAGVIQLCAAVLALALIGPSGRRWTWVALTGALGMQAWRRWYAVLSGKTVSIEDSVVALLISVLMLIVVFGMHRIFVELARANGELERMAKSDALTGLPNRISFMHALNRAIARAARGAHSVILFTDVDGFKQCNDLGGHGFGDGVLCEIADGYRAQIRSPDIVARIGGDEFAVLLEDADSSDGDAAAERLRDSVREAGERVGVELDLSVGMADIGTDLPADKVIAAADRAMYEAKRSRYERVASEQ